MVFLNRGLRERDRFARTTNPVCILHVKSRGSRQWKEVGRTEKVENSLDPEWTKTFEIEYFFEEKQASQIFKQNVCRKPEPMDHPRLLRRGRIKPCLRPVAVIRLHDGDLHAVVWSEGLWALTTPVKAIRVGLGLKNKSQWNKHISVFQSYAILSLSFLIGHDQSCDLWHPIRMLYFTYLWFAKGCSRCHEKQHQMMFIQSVSIQNGMTPTFDNTNDYVGDTGRQL